MTEYTSTSGFTDVTRLPVTTVAGHTVTYQGHHIIPESVAKDSAFLADLKELGTLLTGSGMVMSGSRNQGRDECAE